MTVQDLVDTIALDPDPVRQRGRVARLMALPFNVRCDIDRATAMPSELYTAVLDHIDNVEPGGGGEKPVADIWGYLFFVGESPEGPVALEAAAVLSIAGEVAGWPWWQRRPWAHWN